MARQYIKLEEQAANREELEKLTLGGLRRAVFDGDMKTGSVMMGQIAGLCHEIRPIQEILQGLMKDTKNVQRKIKQNGGGSCMLKAVFFPDKTLTIPIIQGGMGVGISLSSLAGHVMKEGGMGGHQCSTSRICPC